MGGNRSGQLFVANVIPSEGVNGSALSVSVNLRTNLNLPLNLCLLEVRFLIILFNSEFEKLMILKVPVSYCKTTQLGRGTVPMIIMLKVDANLIVNLATSRPRDTTQEDVVAHRESRFLESHIRLIDYY